MRNIANIIVCLLLVLFSASTANAQNFNNKADLSGVFTDDEGTEFTFHKYGGDLVVDIFIYRIFGAENLRVSYTNGVLKVKGTEDDPCDITLTHLGNGRLKGKGTIYGDDYSFFLTNEEHLAPEERPINNPADLTGTFTDGANEFKFYKYNGQTVCDVFIYRMWAEERLPVRYEKGTIFIQGATGDDVYYSFIFKHSAKGHLVGRGTYNSFGPDEFDVKR